MGTRVSNHRPHLAVLFLLLACGVLRAADDEELQPPSEALPPAAAQETPAPGEPGQAAKKDGLRWDIEGYLYEELEYTDASGEASDNDLDSVTNLLFDATHLGEQAWHIRFNGRLHADLVGDSAPDDPLRDFWDQFDGDAQMRLYEVFVDFPKLADGALTIRAGRQYIEEEVFLQFDGARFDYDMGREVEGLNFTVFGGVPVYFPETSRDGDWLLGVVVRGKLGEHTRARLSYYHVTQNFDGINYPVTDPGTQPVSVPPGNVDDDLLGISVWHDFANNLKFYGLFNVLNWDPNELQLQLRWFSEDTRWTATAEFYELFERLVNVANEISPYVPLLGSYEPFLLVGIRGSYRPDDLWVFQGGFSYRGLEDQQDEGTFNHEYWRYFLGVTRLRAFVEELDITVTANGYAGTDGPDVFALTAALDYKVDSEVTVSGGIDYSYYKYVWAQGSERDNVWTYYIEVEWRFKPKMTLDAGISIDVDDLMTYTELTIRFTWRF